MTREDAIKRLKEVRFTVQPYQYINDALDTAIKALEQESVLDKIEAEIEQHRRKTKSIDPYDLVGDCLRIIDKTRRKER